MNNVGAKLRLAIWAFARLVVLSSVNLRSATPLLSVERDSSMMLSRHAWRWLPCAFLTLLPTQVIPEIVKTAFVLEPLPSSVSTPTTLARSPETAREQPPSKTTEASAIR